LYRRLYIFPTFVTVAIQQVFASSALSHPKCY